MRRLIVPLLVIAMIPSAAGLGAAPSVLDLGDIRPGETREVEIHLTTMRSAPFEVRPSPGSPLTSSIFEGEYFDPGAYSEEEIADWFRFTQDSYLVDPMNTTRAEVAGETVSSNGRLQFYLEVPEDAEPGYHVATLQLNPQVDTGSGAATAVIAQAVPTVFFYVERSDSAPQRRISVQNVRAFRTAEDRVRIDTVVRNTGTVTTTLHEGDLDLTGPGGGGPSLDLNSVQLAPGEFETVTTRWSNDNIEAGAYQTRGEISWFTGSMTRQASFSIPDRIEIVPSDQEPGQQPASGEEQQEPLPLWLVAMTLVVLAVLMYSFGIAPIWIFATVGLVGISGFIVMSSVTNAMLAVPLIIFLATVYFV